MVLCRSKPDKGGQKLPAAWLFICAALCCVTARGAERRIEIKPGNTSTTVAGRFPSSGTDQLYVLNARAGQHLLIRIRPITNQLITAGQVKSPSGKYDGGPGGVIFDADLVETGSYQIRISELHRRISGKFLLDVELR